MHNQFLQQAINLANANVTSDIGGPYGAIIVKDGKIIAESANRVTVDTDPTAHAEVVAIRLACKKIKNFKLTDCILYTSCEPCPMCLGAIYWARLKKVYFASDREDAAKAGFDDSFIYEEIRLPPDERHIPMFHINILNAQKPFLNWKMNKDVVPY